MVADFKSRQLDPSSCLLLELGYAKSLAWGGVGFPSLNSTAVREFVGRPQTVA